MFIKSITGDGAAPALKTLNVAAADKAVKHQTAQSNAVDTKNKVSELKKQSPDSEVETRKKPVRAMSHVVKVYNLQGEERTKFMDSHNDVVYQIPSEMVAKLEDQMMKPETSANTKG
jgi:hypothetical protein